MAHPLQFSVSLVVLQFLTYQLLKKTQYNRLWVGFNANRIHKVLREMWHLSVKILGWSKHKQDERIQLFKYVKKIYSSGFYFYF